MKTSKQEEYSRAFALDRADAEARFENPGDVIVGVLTGETFVAEVFGSPEALFIRGQYVICGQGRLVAHCMPKYAPALAVGDVAFPDLGWLEAQPEPSDDVVARFWTGPLAAETVTMAWERLKNAPNLRPAPMAIKYEVEVGDKDVDFELMLVGPGGPPEAKSIGITINKRQSQSGRFAHCDCSAFWWDNITRAVGDGDPRDWHLVWVDFSGKEPVEVDSCIVEGSKP